MFRIILILIFALASTPAFSQVGSGPIHSGRSMWQKNGIVVDDSLGRSVRQNAKVVCMDDGSSIVVWEDERNGYSDIYAQRLDGSGAKLWGKNGIGVCEAQGNQTSPQIISDGRSAIVVWQDYRGDSADIYAQKITMSGSALWAKDGVPVCTAETNQLEPQLTSNGAGGAIITWYDYRSGKGEDIYAQGISKAGSIEWQTNGVPVCTAEGTQWHPKIVTDGLGGSVICWDDNRDNNYDTYAQRLDAKGHSLWQINGIAVCAAPDNQEYSQIASCEGDSFVITWQDYRNGNADIFAQKIDLTGRTLWKTNGEVVCDVAGNQERPQIVAGKDPIIIWTDYRNGTGNSDVFCQKMSSAGTPLWDQYGVSLCEASGNQANLKAASDGQDGAIIVWQDQRIAQGGIFLRRITKDGKALCTIDGMTVCKGNFAEFPQVSFSDNGNMIIVWQDKRNGGLDVYAQGIDINSLESWKGNGVEVALGFGSVTQQKARIKRTSRDEYVIVWEDYRNGYSNVFAQKISNNGKLLWPRDGIRICNTESDQYNPELVDDDDGGALIVWEDTRSGITNIYAQRIDPDGNLLWDGSGIRLCLADGSEISPKLSKDSKGGAIVAWQDSRKSEDLFNIYAQRIGNNGSLLWRVDGVPVKSSDGTQTDMSIDSDDKDGAVITWEQYRRNLNTPDIYAQKINGDGDVMWTNTGLTVCKAPESQKQPDIAVNNEIVIAWEDNGGGNYDIYSQKLGKDGTIAWPCDGVPVCTEPHTQINPKVITDGSGGAIYVWEDYRNSNWDIYTQRLNSAGKQMWLKFGVAVCTAEGTQYSPQLVKSNDQSTIITWEDYRNNKSYNIYAQKINWNGEILWKNDGVPLCLTEGGARNPQLADDGEGGAVVVWTDYRYGSYDIYAQRINEAENK
jgi:hypothetical protein